MTPFIALFHQILAHMALTEEVFKTIRGSLFSANLSLGGFMLALFAFATTRVHDLMKSEGAKKERGRLSLVAARRVDFTKSLHRCAEMTLQAVVIFFTAALLQITLGLFGGAWGRWICLIVSVLAILNGGRSAWHTIRYYMSWLKFYSVELAEEAEKNRPRLPPLDQAS